MCNKQFKLKGTEVLEKAKVSTSDNSITQIEVIHKNKIWKFIRVAAACLIIPGLVFATKKYSIFDSVRYYFKKPPNQIDYIEDTNIMDKFTVQLDNATFEASELIIAFDVTVHDEMLVANNNKLKLSAYICDKSNENSYMCDAYGQKDDKVSNLYHVYMRRQCEFMNEDQKFMALLLQISFEKDDTNDSHIYPISYKYDFEVTKDASQNEYNQK